MKIGVVIPMHGESRSVAEAIESVRAQTFEHWRLVVVANGAQPGPVAVAERFAAADQRIRLVRQDHADVAEARNRGVAEIGGDADALSFLDHDDRWLPGALQTLAVALAAAPASVAAHAAARFIAESGALVRIGELESAIRRRRGVQDGRLVEWPPERPTDLAIVAVGIVCQLGTLLIRRDALDRVGPFDPRAVPADDYDLWIRLARLGPLAFVDRLVLEYRLNPTPTWKRPRRAERAELYVRRKALTCAENSPAQTRLLRDGYRASRRLLASEALRDATAAARRFELQATARKLGRAVIQTAAYLYGQPGRWHR